MESQQCVFGVFDVEFLQMGKNIEPVCFFLVEKNILIFCLVLDSRSVIYHISTLCIYTFELECLADFYVSHQWVVKSCWYD